MNYSCWNAVLFTRRSPVLNPAVAVFLACVDTALALKMSAPHNTGAVSVARVHPFARRQGAAAAGANCCAGGSGPAGGARGGRAGTRLGGVMFRCIASACMPVTVSLRVASNLHSITSIGQSTRARMYRVSTTNRPQTPPPQVQAMAISVLEDIVIKHRQHLGRYATVSQHVRCISPITFHPVL